MEPWTIPGCPRCNRGNSFADVPQIFVANFIYETPELAGWNKGLKLALGGWQISGIYRAQSGQASFGGIACGCTSSWQLDGTDLADYASGVKSVTTHPGDLLHYLDASQFVQPQQGESGTTGKKPAGFLDLASIPGTWGSARTSTSRSGIAYRSGVRCSMPLTGLLSEMPTTTLRVAASGKSPAPTATTRHELFS